MTQPGKRRPDGRAIRPTKTYSIQELAEATNKTAATVEAWIRQGLPLIDDLQPALIHGWQAREWLGGRWAGRRVQCPDGTFFCMGCRQPREPAAGSVIVEPSPSGSARVSASCVACGAIIHRSMSNQQAVDFQRAVRGLTSEIRGFTDSGISPDKRTDPADPGIGAADGAGQDAAKSAGAAPGRSPEPSSFQPRNPRNARLKRSFLTFLDRTRGRSQRSLRKDEIALQRLETFFAHADFRLIDVAQSHALIDRLRASKLRGPTMQASLTTIRIFLEWLAARPGMLQTNQHRDALQQLRISRKEARANRAHAIRTFPKLEDVVRLVLSLPARTLQERRDRALLAFFAGTAIRVSAAVSLKLRHLDGQRRTVRQYSQEVDTKFSKDMVTSFFWGTDELERVVWDYVACLRSEYGFGDDDPLFPKTVFEKGTGAKFQRRAVAREHWADHQMATRIIADLFAANGMPKHTPHDMRHMQGYRRETLGLTDAQREAWSINMGHGDKGTTSKHYGNRSPDEHIRLVRQAPGAIAGFDVDALTRLVAATVQSLQGLPRATTDPEQSPWAAVGSPPSTPAAPGAALRPGDPQMPSPSEGDDAPPAAGPQGTADDGEV